MTVPLTIGAKKVSSNAAVEGKTANADDVMTFGEKSADSDLLEEYGVKEIIASEPKYAEATARGYTGTESYINTSRIVNVTDSSSVSVFYEAKNDVIQTALIKPREPTLERRRRNSVQRSGISL